MIPLSDILAQIRAQAAAYAARESEDIRALPAIEIREAIEPAIRAAYLRGADAGYTAAKAEERK